MKPWVCLERCGNGRKSELFLIFLIVHYFLNAVNTQEFEHQYQESVGKILNELQSMAIISNRLESTIVEVGTSVQNLNKMVEEFLKEQKREDQKREQITNSDDTPPSDSAAYDS